MERRIYPAPENNVTSHFRAASGCNRHGPNNRRGPHPEALVAAMILAWKTDDRFKTGAECVLWFGFFLGAGKARLAPTSNEPRMC